MYCSYVAASFVCATLVAGPLSAQDLSAYREVHLGDNLQKVIASTGTTAADVRVVHERPALMQELEWRLRRLGGPVATTDPVRRVTFSFYSDQLYRVFVSYERSQIDGLTDADLIESLSGAYGTALTSAAAKVLRPSETPGIGEHTQQVVARWENADYSIVLVRGAYLAPLSLVMIAKHVANDARSAGTEATRLDLSEQPGRDAARGRDEAEARRLALEKARPANKAGFKP